MATKMSYDDFMTPFKGNSAISLKGKIEEFKRLYFEYYAKEILVSCVYNKIYDVYTFFFKVPSGQNDKYPTALLYDVVIEFSPKNKNSERHLANIDGYGIRIFSNSPSFIFTFDYVVKHRYGFPACVGYGHLSKVAISKPPEVRNTYELMTIEKTTWVCFYHLVHNGYLSKNFITPILSNKNESYFMKNVVSQPMKLKEIKVLQEEVKEQRIRDKAERNKNINKSYNKAPEKKNPLAFSFKFNNNNRMKRAIEKHNDTNKFKKDMYLSMKIANQNIKPGGKK